MAELTHFSVQQTIIKMINAVDTKRWEEAQAQFEAQVTVDYSSLTQQPKADVPAAALVQGWQQALAKAHTHHMVTNFDCSVQAERALVECHVYASHQADGLEGWDLFGRYQFELIETHDQWRIAAMTLIVHGQKGNTAFMQQLN
ncbi:nuclear transport factor 2 family protein [Vibrio alfacsensis]|uniref:nuclear transport factor 2 family protein n=1 Tax=Vibrio alfacsensis TaxID=1074311 RepID=UPI004068566B